jgi:hypothetical protein
VFKSIQILFIGLIAALLLTACGPTDQDAQQLGFANVAEMKELQAKGFKTKGDFIKSNEEKAKSLGFESAQEMKTYTDVGWKNKKDYLDYMDKEAQKYGFANWDAQKENDSWFKSFDLWRVRSLIDNEYKDGRSKFSPAFNNRTREEQAVYDEEERTLAKYLKEGVGKKLINRNCWWIWAQVSSSNELVCYDTPNEDYHLFGKTKFTDVEFRINLTPAQSKDFGPIYQKDKFIFTGAVKRVEGQYPFDGGNMGFPPIRIYVTASSVERAK